MRVGRRPAAAVAMFGGLLLALQLGVSAVSAHELTGTPVGNPADDERNVRAWSQELRVTGGAGRLTTSAEPSTLRAAELRREALERLAQSNPRRASELVLTAQERNRLPASLQALVEQPAAITGDLLILHIDSIDFKGPSEFQLELTDTAGLRHVLALATSLNGARSGSRIYVSGSALAGAGPLLVTSVAVIQSAAPAIPTGAQRTAVLLASAAGAPAHPYANKSNTASMFFSSTNLQSARSFYALSSYGQTTIEGAAGEGTAADVYGPYVIGVALGTCDRTSLESQALQAATDLPYSRYDRIVIAWNDPSSICSFGSWATLGSALLRNLPGGAQYESVAVILAQYFGSTDFNGKVSNTTLHEYGHNLGVRHAGVVKCGQAVLDDPSCYDVEYGDPADVMGSSLDGQMNSIHKEELGWLGGRVQTATSAGYYTLYPYEDASGTTKVLKVPRARDAIGNVTGYYYLEYRRPQAPWNSYTQYQPAYAEGVLVHQGSDDGGCIALAGCPAPFRAHDSNDSLLLNTQPNSSSSGHTDLMNAPLLLSQSYADQGAGVTFQITDISPSSATVYLSESTPRPTIQTLVYPPMAGSINGGGVMSPGQPVSLVAVANNGYQFSTWHEVDQDQSYSNPYSFIVAGDRLLEAVFVALPTGPPNDSFAAATAIPGLPAHLTAALANATTEPGEPLACQGTPIAHTVWFTYTSPGVPTMVSLDTTASTFDTVIGVYTGSSVSGLSSIAGHGCDDGTLDWTFRAKLAFLAQPNTVYQVQVGSRFANFNPVTPGEFVLDVASGASPASANYWANPPSEWLPGQTQTYQAVFTNTGSSAWSASGPTAVHLSVSFGGPSDTPGADWISEQRFNLPSDVQPNGRAYLTITVAPPPQTGAFVLRHRLVQDNVGWLFGGLKTTAHVSVYCTARPNVVLNAIPGSGQLTVVIAAGGSNSIRSVSIGNPSAPVNALIDAGGQVGVNHPLTVYLGPGRKQMTFVIRRATPGLATTVPFTVQDDCGNWPTLAGGGPNAF